ncbi:MAG TPA: phosphatidate cytidylyltransferase, partial [Bryobacteraceae bacterium]|nr:phosphatidate cytidylyltransferase [Bryobacteraceae bacterium]
CWIGDAGAYYVGRRLGRHKLAPRISPGKSWEGAIASVAVSVLFGVFYLARFLPSVPAAAAIAISAVANIAGQLGDLAESAIKRGAGVKDSGTILPGHGGFLDRVDSTLFVLPVVYLYIRFVQ